VWHALTGGRSVLHTVGDDLDHYSDGRPVATTLNVGAGTRWVRRRAVPCAPGEVAPLGTPGR
jgi:hypothetical protein